MQNSPEKDKGCCKRMKEVIKPPSDLMRSSFKLQVAELVGCVVPSIQLLVMTKGKK